MNANVIDLRLRKIEKAMQTSEFDALSDEQLLILIRANLEEVVKPFGRNVIVAADAMRDSSDPEERECAKALDHIVENWNEFYPAA